MRIISKTPDYYDGVQRHGNDDHVVFVREPIITELGDRTTEHNPKPKWPGEDFFAPFHDDHPELVYRQTNRMRYPSVYSKWERASNGRVTKAVLYFCGKAYPFYVAETAEGPVFSYEEAFQPLVEQRKFWWNPKADKRTYDKWLTEMWGKEIKPDIHFELQAPIILYIGKTLIVNPCLKEFRFQRIIEPYTAFQEIEMFLGGVLGSIEKEGPEMSDKEKVSSHGMDPKWSFRKKVR
jgi:hypothetical protein